MLRRTCLLAAGLVVLTGCATATSHAYTTQTPATQAPAASTTTPSVAPVAPKAPILFTASAFDLQSAGPVGPAASDAAQAGVLDTLNRYLDAAVLTPLRSGGPAGDLTPLFTRPAVDRVMAAGPDRSAFIDENLPPVSDLRKESAAAGLTALAGEDGVLRVITAGLDLRLIGHIDGELVSVVRTGDLVLVPDGGSWRIDAYDVSVTRSWAAGTTVTTVRS